MHNGTLGPIAFRADGRQDVIGHSLMVAAFLARGLGLAGVWRARELLYFVADHCASPTACASFIRTRVC